jgi:hypothetical protein
MDPRVKRQRRRRVDSKENEPVSEDHSRAA